MTNFKIGCKVKHKLNDQIMILVEQVVNKVRSEKRNFLDLSKTYYDYIPTDDVICKWVDKDNNPKQAQFNINELELVE